MRITATLAKIEFDAKGAQEDFLGALYHVMLRAAEQFMNEAAPRVPIDTGMARGSFLNLMHLLNANGYGHGVFIPTEPLRTKNDGNPLRYYPVRVGRIHGVKTAVYSKTTLPKTPATAMQLSTAINSILTLKGKEWVFTYETRVAHYNINDRARNWQSFRLGRKAMDVFLQSPTALEMLPSLTSYVRFSSLSSGRSNPFSNFSVKTQKKVTR